MHRSWIKAADKRYKAYKAGMDTREQAVRLVNKLKLREGDAFVDFVEFVMASPQVVCDSR